MHEDNEAKDTFGDSWVRSRIGGQNRTAASSFTSTTLKVYAETYIYNINNYIISYSYNR